MWQIILFISLFIIGYGIIYFFADIFIENLKDLCAIFNISPFIIGLLILGIDPEESIASIIAALNGLVYLSVGNVIGNSILALTICFSLPALFYRINTKSIDQFYFSLLYACMIIMLMGFLLNFGLFITGIVLIFVYFVYFIRSIKYLSNKIEYNSINNNKAFQFVIVNKDDIERISKSKKVIFICFSLLVIFLGGGLLIFSTEQLINLTGISESFFGFIIIAFVTNVEELTLVFKSIKKKSLEIGLGGMIGKLIWNLTITLGISGLLAICIDFSWNLIWNWLLLLILIFYFNLISKKRYISRNNGIILLATFIIFIAINLLTLFT